MQDHIRTETDQQNSTTNIIHTMSHRSLPMAMAQQACLHQGLLTAEAPLRTHLTPCGIQDTQSEKGAHFYTGISVSTCQLLLHYFSVLYHHGFRVKRGPADTV